MIWICVECGFEKPFSKDESMCLIHMRILDLVTPPQRPTSCPGPETDPEPLQPNSDYCWNCDEPVPDRRNTDCLRCHKKLTPPALQLRFPHGEIELGAGEQTTLGRLGPHARVFREHPNVSRRHAIVGVDRSGHAWIEPLDSAPNGTFVDGDELEPRRHPLVGRKRLRLAADVDCEVRIFRAVSQ